MTDMKISDMKINDMKIHDVINYLPNASRNIQTNEEKFLFFFEPKLMDEKKFLFGFSLKNGVQVFSVISLIQAINAFFDIFKPEYFTLFFVNIVIFAIYSVNTFYTVLSTIKDNYEYARMSYLISAILFLLYALKYVLKSFIKTIKFITPWEQDFLRLDFLAYIFGYGILLFIILYFVYVLYHYMLELKNQTIVKNNENEESIPVKEPMKSD